MIVLAIRTDREAAEVALFGGKKKLNSIIWQAHRTLAVSLNSQIKKLLDMSSNSYEQIDGIVVFIGPGSFTGLRISASVANALAYSLDIPLVGESGENWQKNGIEALEAGKNNKISLPKYGSPAKTTTPRK